MSQPPLPCRSINRPTSLDGTITITIGCTGTGPRRNSLQNSHVEGKRETDGGVPCTLFIRAESIRGELLSRSPLAGLPWVRVALFAAADDATAEIRKPMHVDGGAEQKTIPFLVSTPPPPTRVALEAHAVWLYDPRFKHPAGPTDTANTCEEDNDRPAPRPRRAFGFSFPLPANTRGRMSVFGRRGREGPYPPPRASFAVSVTVAVGVAVGVAVVVPSLGPPEVTSAVG